METMNPNHNRKPAVRVQVLSWFLGRANQQARSGFQADSGKMQMA
jgi:hypothetical protein